MHSLEQLPSAARYTTATVSAIKRVVAGSGPARRDPSCAAPALSVGFLCVSRAALSIIFGLAWKVSSASPGWCGQWLCITARCCTSRSVASVGADEGQPARTIRAGRAAPSAQFAALFEGVDRRLVRPERARLRCRQDDRKRPGNPHFQWKKIAFHDPLISIQTADIQCENAHLKARLASPRLAEVDATLAQTQESNPRLTGAYGVWRQSWLSAAWLPVPADRAFFKIICPRLQHNYAGCYSVPDTTLLTGAEYRTRAQHV